MNTTELPGAIGTEQAIDEGLFEVETLEHAAFDLLVAGGAGNSNCNCNSNTNSNSHDPSEEK